MDTLKQAAEQAVAAPESKPDPRTQHILHGGWKCAFCGFDGQDNKRGNHFCAKCRKHV